MLMKLSSLIHIRTGRSVVCFLSSLLLLPVLFLSAPLTAAAAPAAGGNSFQEEAEARKELPVQSNEWENWPAGPLIGAQAAIIMEANTGAILYEKNIHDQLYPASVTKILTALIAIENCPLDDIVTYSNEAVASIDWQTDSNIGIKPGEQITMEQSLYGLLVGSANEVGNAIGEHISGSMGAFVDLMNQRARELGCRDSHFVTTNGTFDEAHYTSAYDLALIARAFFSNDLLCKMSDTANYTIPASATVSQEMNIHSKNQLYPGKTYAYEYLVGSKTGYTSEARQTLVSCAQKDGLKLICVILKEESPAQYTDTIELFNYGFSNFRAVNVSEADTRYAVGNNSFFESDSDVFGNSSPLLTINPSDIIVLPNTADYKDLESSLNYDDSAKGTAVKIDFTYNGTFVGSASIEMVPQKVTASDKTTKPSVAPGKVYYINIKLILIGVAIAVLVLFLIIYVISLIRNYSFGKRRKISLKRSKRRKTSTIDFDRSTKGPDGY